jgi:hypothetical protein
MTCCLWWAIKRLWAVPHNKLLNHIAVCVSVCSPRSSRDEVCFYVAYYQIEVQLHLWSLAIVDSGRGQVIGSAHTLHPEGHFPAPSNIHCTLRLVPAIAPSFLVDTCNGQSLNLFWLWWQNTIDQGSYIQQTFILHSSWGWEIQAQVVGGFGVWCGSPSGLIDCYFLTVSSHDRREKELWCLWVWGTDVIIRAVLSYINLSWITSQRSHL